MNKGVFVVFLLALLLVPGVFAIPSEYEIADKAVTGVSNILKPLMSALVGESNDPDFLYAKSIVFIFLLTLICTIVRKIPTLGDNKLVVFVLGATSSLIAVRYITPERFSALLLPTDGLTLALFLGIPVMLTFFALHLMDVPAFGRRFVLGLITFAYLVLGISRWGEIPNEFVWFYLSAVVFILIMIMFDKGVHGYFKKWEIDKFYIGAKERTIAALQAEYLNIINVNTTAGKNRRAAIEAELIRLGSNIP
ncbi:hypothetical protein FJZ22_02145 [Candidatus Pacearchaeota archaeon]|nr:hypothetical protein [Candidatus Pacearchaeota archaeon]